MSKTRILFDTNVLVYAHDAASRYHSDSAALLLQAFQQNVQGILAEQNIIELYRILTNPVAMTGNALTPQQTRALLKTTYLNGNFEVIYPNFSTIDRLLDLTVTRNVTSAKIFDLRLAALVLESQIDYFATYNLRDFQQINDLNASDPSTLLALLSL